MYDLENMQSICSRLFRITAIIFRKLGMVGGGGGLGGGGRGDGGGVGGGGQLLT
jgi:hypothetical protein